ncbi:MAG TPA: hypothetical protein VHC69_18430 [Polyangiaceae bacterium]|nr:hypothetical protein [Polyangiaceae bacterium]
MKRALLAAMAASVSITSAGVSDAVVKWSDPSHRYDSVGNYPSAAQGVNVWADAHQGDGDALWYHVSTQSNGYNYDHGYFPTIATDTWGNYVEIHQASSVASSFSYKFGYDDGSGAQYMLGNAAQNDWGMSPFIAVHGHPCDQQQREYAFGDIVQVHQGNTGVSPLWMNVAQATNIYCNNNNLVGSAKWGGIQWLGAKQYNQTGFYPSVAVNALPGGRSACYLEVHQDGPGLGTVRWSSGQITISGGLPWTAGTSWSFNETDSGTFTPAAQHASVCIYDGNGGANYKDTGVIVMEFNDGSLWSFDGPIGGNTATGVQCLWTAQNAQPYDHGAYPRLSCQNGLLSGRSGVQGIEVHQGTNTTSPSQLWYRTFTDTSF